MAFNWSTFRTRSITAIVFVVVMLAGLLLSKWSFFILLTVIHFGCWIEFNNLLEKINKDYRKIIPFHRYGFMIAGWAILLYFTNDELWLFGVRLREVGLWLGILSMIILPLVLFVSSKGIFLKNMGQSTFGLFYISLALGLLMDIRMTHEVASAWNVDLYLFYVLFIILSLWINDTMAYIVGSFVGKTQLSAISPKKTWEGTIGGIILAIVVMSIIGRTGGLSIRNGAIIATVASISGTYGDLFESKLKRMAGVKDSGNIMPGHGGFLDRFDSLLFAATCCWMFIRVIIDLHL